LLSTHILMEVEAICERVILIAAGRLRLDQSLAELEAESVTHVEVQAPAQAVADALRPFGHDVSTKVHDDGWIHAGVESRDDRRGEISLAVTSRGWPLRRLERKRRSLEEVYFDVLRGGSGLTSRADGG